MPLLKYILDFTTDSFIGIAIWNRNFDLGTLYIFCNY